VVLLVMVDFDVDFLLVRVEVPDDAAAHRYSTHESKYLCQPFTSSIFRHSSK